MLSAAFPGGNAVEDASERKKQEILNQAQMAVHLGEIPKTPVGVVERYRQLKHWKIFPKEYTFKCMAPFEGKRILDFGCGEGEISTQLALLGAQVTGVDISPELVDLGRIRAKLDGVEDRIQFIAGDITTLNLPPQSFDHVLCYAVLHHVDLQETPPHLLKVLKPGGTMLMAEPTLFVRFLRKIRRLFPLYDPGTDTQEQFTQKEIGLVSAHFQESEVAYFNCFARLQRLFPNRDRIDEGHPFTRAAVLFLYYLDAAMIRVLPFMWRFYGNAVIVGRKASK